MVFISYSSRDQHIADEVVRTLEARHLACWIAPRDIVHGVEWDAAIVDGLDRSLYFVLILSGNSNQSPDVLREVRLAKKRKIPVIPIRIEDMEPTGSMEYLLEGLHRLEAVTRPLEPHLKVLAGRLAPTTSPTVALAVKTNPIDGLPYVWIPPGRFMMGCSPGDDECRDNEKPAHEEVIGKGFWLGQTPVTQEAYQRVIGSNPSYFKGPRRPVECVTWHDAVSYAAKIGGRLPTEAEWEYAARATNTSARYGPVDEIAWHSGNSGRETHDVGGKVPNKWGLYDMLGNVWEWTADLYPGSQSKRTLRGGSFYIHPRIARSSDRYWYVPGLHYYDSGLRCAWEIP
jgi:formylglycine-generating enzyme required for sulfatase activity